MSNCIPVGNKAAPFISYSVIEVINSVFALHKICFIGEVEAYSVNRNAPFHFSEIQIILRAETGRIMSYENMLPLCTVSSTGNL